jgi:hypothetical protein
MQRDDPQMVRAGRPLRAPQVPFAAIFRWRAGRRKPLRSDLVSVSTEYAKCMTFFVMGMLVCRSRAELFAQLRSTIFNLACRSLRLLLEPLDQGALTGVGVKRLL